ncbi:Protein tssc1 [Coemansia sp. RSA 2705]|nr:Protein tssc1 [Coemansia sp. RSA 2705]
MEVSQGASHVYGIDRHTLCLAAVAGNPARSRFVLGTLGINEPSEIHLVDFDSDENTLSSLVYTHSCGVRALAAAPWNAAHLVVVNNGSLAPASRLVELVELPDAPEGPLAGQGAAEPGVRVVAALECTDLQMPHSAACHPTAPRVAVAAAGGVQIWDVAAAAATPTHAIHAARHAMADVQAVAWHPTAPAQLSTADGSCVRSWDTRADPRNAQTLAIEHAHGGTARALDYNPTLPYVLASGGDDGAVRLWDARAPASPLMQIANHTHWVYSLAFNPNHDQLVLSAGADGLVNLESVVSVSSAHVVAGLEHRLSDAELQADRESDAAGSLADESEPAVDGLVAQYDDHETSVYAAAWSPADPWVFASLSFDGRLVINTVPLEEKYKILL